MINSVNFFSKVVKILYIKWSLYTSRLYFSLIDKKKVSIKGLNPKDYSSIYTIPHLDTVAGDTCVSSQDSKIIFKCGKTFILYPFDKHSILLSSNKVLRFSTQDESTGPSNIIQSYSRPASFWTDSFISFPIICLLNKIFLGICLNFLLHTPSTIKSYALRFVALQKQNHEYQSPF